MLIRLIALLTVVPALELLILLWMGAWMGPLPTLALVLLTGVAGALALRASGRGVLAELRDAAQRGVPPARHFVEGALVLVGGALLLTPGLLTDAAGLLCVLPPTRHRLATPLTRWLLAHASVVAVETSFGAAGAGARYGSAGPTRPAGPAGPAGPPRDNGAPPSSGGLPRPGFDHPVP